MEIGPPIGIPIGGPITVPTGTPTVDQQIGTRTMRKIFPRDKCKKLFHQHLSLGNIFLMVLVPICWSTVGVPGGTVIGPPVGIPPPVPISKFYYLNRSRS